jgi:predicted ribonuclease YlaK
MTFLRKLLPPGESIAQSNIIKPKSTNMAKRKTKGSQEGESFKLVDIPKSIGIGPLSDISPMTKTQELVFNAYQKDYNVVMSGAAGCGKTFIAIAMALKQIIAENYKMKLIIVRSVVPTRDMGFLPGSQADKEAAYTTPYEEIVNELFCDGQAWKKLIDRGTIRFLTTSFIRGITIRNAIILVDEAQNCNFHELDSIMTRCGTNSRIIFTGDYYQTDFERDKDKNGINEFIEIVDRLKYFKHVRFGWEDIVRSSLVRDYIMTKEMIQREKSSNNKQQQK